MCINLHCSHLLNAYKKASTSKAWASYNNAPRNVFKLPHNCTANELSHVRNIQTFKESASNSKMRVTHGIYLITDRADLHNLKVT